MYLWLKIWLLRLNSVNVLYAVYIYVYACMYRVTNTNTPARCSFYPTIVWSTSSVGDILMHFTLTHWRILMPCHRPRFTQLLTVPYVTLIIIHVEWINIYQIHFTRLGFNRCSNVDLCPKTDWQSRNYFSLCTTTIFSRNRILLWLCCRSRSIFFLWDKEDKL